MNQSISEQLIQDVALEFKFDFQRRNLKSLIAERLGGNATPNDIFNVMSVINQWAKPCLRPLDLRSRDTENVIEKVAYEGVTHYLDPLSRDVFFKTIVGYDNKYTFGVYEEVTEFAEKNQDRIAVAALSAKFDLQPLHLGDRVARSEERMNLGVKVSVYACSKDVEPRSLSAADELDGVTIKQAVTVDISFTGLQIKLNREVKTTYVALRFTSFEDEYMFSQKLVVYKVLGRRREKGDIFVFLKLLDIPENEEFRSFSAKLINNNKFRYKVSLENTMESATNRVYEQFLMPHYQGVALLLDKQNQARFRTCSPLAIDLDQFFFSHRQSALNTILNSVLPPLETEYDEYSIVVYRRQKKDQPGIYLFYATRVSTDSRRFADYALAKATSGVFMVRRRKIEGSELLNTITLENQTSKESHAFKVAPKLPPILNELCTLITVEQIPAVFCDEWRSADTKFTVEEIKAFNQYLVKQTKPDTGRLCLLEVTSSSSLLLPIRQDVLLTHADKRIGGYTASVGNEQLIVRCSQRLPFKNADTVSLSTSYQPSPKVEAFTLTADYRVSSIKGNTVALTATTGHAKQAWEYWADVLKAMKIPIADTEHQELPEGTGLAMRNLVSKYHESAVVFLSMRKNYPCTTKIALSDTHRLSDCALAEALEAKSDALKKDIWYSEQVLEALSSAIRKSESGAQTEPLFMAVALHPSNKMVMRCKIWTKDEFDTEAFLMFVKFNKTSKIEAGWISMDRTTPLFDKYFIDELKYIGKYAPHKAKQLLSEAEKTTFVAQWHDMTSLVDITFDGAT